ncbi:MAG TPA: NAD(P)-dependent oxidoreductase [Actinomycetota bacterium]|nr:NAD(P)-dependent oxidoreductase [Actinomycetota bacterium]
MRRIGFVGLGTMGAPMARNLLSAGFAVTVHNRTRVKEEPLAALGAARAATPADAARDAEAVVVIVSDTPDVEQVLFGPGGVVSGAGPGTVVIDMSTISPGATRSFGSRLAEAGLELVDAPVSGGSEGAEAATLTVMVGGDPTVIGRVRPVFEAVGSKVTHVGPLGAGQAAKAVNQVIVGGMYLAVAEGVALAEGSGLDVERVLEAIGSGACRSWVLENRSRNMVERRHPLGFRLALHRKDLGIALDEARRANVNLPLSDLVAHLEDRLVASGLGDQDVSALMEALRKG